MPNVHYTDVQFGFQNVFRTVTVAYQPYIPFTQAYRMQIDAETATMASQGASSVGYFKMAPQDDSALGENERDGYPWPIRLQAYQGAGEGRLATMSSMMDREARVLGAARQIEGEAASNVMGKRLADLLEHGGNRLSGYQARSSRIASELEIEFLDNLFTQEGVTTSQRTLQRGSGYGRAQDFDLFLENNDTFRQFVEEDLGGGGVDRLVTDQVHSFELEDRRSGRSSHKILGRIDAEGMSVSGARVAWANHITNTINEWNTEIQNRWISGSSVASNTADDYTNVRDLFAGGATSGMDYEIRQFMNRMARNIDIDRLNAAVTGASHLYSNQLGGNYVGFTVFYPDRAGDIPQIGWDGNVVVLHTTSGRVVEAFMAWAGRTQTFVGTTATELGALAAQQAVDVAVSTEARLLAMGAYGVASNVASIIDNIRPVVTFDQHFTSTDIALSLSQQIQEHLDRPQTISAFGDWYRDLMEQSNTLSTSWHKAAGKIGGPVFGHPLSEEWQFGDEPKSDDYRKHYLGLWNREDENAWKGDLTTGYNFSVSPMVVSRRVGSAGYGQ